MKRIAACLLVMLATGCGKSFTEAEAIYKDEEAKLRAIADKEMARRSQNYEKAKNALKQWRDEHGFFSQFDNRTNTFIISPDLQRQHDDYVQSLVQDSTLGLCTERSAGGYLSVVDKSLVIDGKLDDSVPDFTAAYNKQKEIADKAWDVREAAKK